MTNAIALAVLVKKYDEALAAYRAALGDPNVSEQDCGDLYRRSEAAYHAIMSIRPDTIDTSAKPVD